MNYEEMTDFEIDAAVTRVIHDCHGWEINWTSRCFFHCGVDGSGYYRRSIANYCTNPSDAWPIITDNNISLHYEWHKKGKYTAIGTRWSERSLGPHSESLEVTLDKGQELRAAMICFLEMKGSKQ